MWKNLMAALIYSVSSFTIMFVNKIVLTVYHFPSFNFLALGQFVMSLFLLILFKGLGFINFAPFRWDTFIETFPVPLFFVLNAVCGLGGTQNLSIPMLTVLRRFSILFTMLGEYWILKKKPSPIIQFSVGLMLVGALIAALNDLSFDLLGYVLVFLSNFFTAANGVLSRLKLDSKKEDSFWLIYYNSIFAIPCCLVLMLLNKESDIDAVIEFEYWNDFQFVSTFLLSCVLGFVLSYSTFLCTTINSPLTTSVIGSVKNILSTYVGMFIGGDYVYEINNFLGLNISVLGTLIYSSSKLLPGLRGTSEKPKKKPDQETPSPNMSTSFTKDHF